MKNIAIIGGGPSGLAQVKALNVEPYEFEIDLYESRSVLGGIWNYTDTKSRYTRQEQLDAAKDYNFSPMYRKLETNIVHKAMEYKNIPFPENTKDFPFRTDVLAYLQNYIKTIGPCNKYMDTRVTSVSKKGNLWQLSGENVLNGTVSTKSYDGIVVANGHFETPRFPKVEGLDDWQATDPDSISHAKFFDTPDKYEGKTILIVGGFASGSDLAIQATLFAKKIYVSCDEKTVLTGEENPYVELIPRISKYDVSNRSITFEDKTIEGIDEVLFCTGYEYDIPFLDLDICRNRYIADLYEHIFYIQDPSLVFIGLCKEVAPFPLAEAQSGLTARYYSGRLKLPTKEVMQQSFEGELEKKGDAGFHSFKFPLEPEYINNLHKLLKEQDLLDGPSFDIYEGERLERRRRVPEFKLLRVIEQIKTNVAERNKKN